MKSSKSGGKIEPELFELRTKESFIDVLCGKLFLDIINAKIKINQGNFPHY